MTSSYAALIEATPIRKILTTWHKWGFSGASIASATGASKATLDGISSGRTKHVTRAVYQEITKLDYKTIFRTAPDVSMVASYPSVRRVKALNRIGWSLSDIGEAIAALGGPLSLPRHLMDHGTESITARNHRYIETVYESMSGRPGKSKRTIQFSIKGGYPAPLSWDDIESYHERPRGMIR